MSDPVNVPQRPPRERCTATSRRTGKRCGQWPVQGRTVCKWHGGLGGRTPDPSRPGSRYRGFLPDRLRRGFDAALGDLESQASLRYQMAILDARFISLQAALRDIEKGEMVCARCTAALGVYESLVALGRMSSMAAETKAARMAGLIAELGQRLQGAGAAAKIQEEIDQIDDRLARFKETENRMQERSAKVFTLLEFSHYLKAIFLVVSEVLVSGLEDHECADTLYNRIVQRAKETVLGDGVSRHLESLSAETGQ